jgi:hypothetical protein
MNLSMISYISVEGRTDAIENVDFICKIADLSIEKFGFYESVILSATKPSIEPKYAKIVPIPSCNYYEYSKIAFNELHKHVKKDYILIFQNDGFALNENLWDDQFLNYDYIGAPWPSFMSWSHPGKEIGNGGFSLRTRKLYEECSNLEYQFGYNEDGLICVFYRNYFESINIKFSPLSIGYKFSVENEYDENHSIYNTFGFHGKQHVDIAKKIFFNE